MRISLSLSLLSISPSPFLSLPHSYLISLSPSFSNFLFVIWFPIDNTSWSFVSFYKQYYTMQKSRSCLVFFHIEEHNKMKAGTPFSPLSLSLSLFHPSPLSLYPPFPLAFSFCPHFSSRHLSVSYIPSPMSLSHWVLLTFYGEKGSASCSRITSIVCWRFGISLRMGPSFTL